MVHRVIEEFRWVMRINSGLVELRLGNWRVREDSAGEGRLVECRAV